MYVSLHKSTLHLGARQRIIKAVLVSFLEPQFGTKPNILGQVSGTELPYCVVNFLLDKMFFFTGQNHHFIHIMGDIQEKVHCIDGISSENTRIRKEFSLKTGS